MITSFKMALRSIGSSKLRAVLTMLGIIIGVMALVVLVSLVNGATNSVTDAVSELGSSMISVTVVDDKGKPITLEELAEIAKLSPFYFSHMFKRETGFAPMEYVINTRIEHAKTLLLTTSMSISEIAEEVGYSSSGSLINLFVKKVGSSPGQYRKSHKSLKR